MYAGMPQQNLIRINVEAMFGRTRLLLNGSGFGFNGEEDFFYGAETIRRKHLAKCSFCGNAGDFRDN